MIELKRPAEIERMRTTGRFVARVLTDLGDLADVGVNLLDLEHHARGLIRDGGAQSCYWDYAPSFGRGPFRNVVCLSVNDAVLHGLPHDYTLRDGGTSSAWTSRSGSAAGSRTPLAPSSSAHRPTRTCASCARRRRRSSPASGPRRRATGWATSPASPCVRA